MRLRKEEYDALLEDPRRADLAELHRLYEKAKVQALAAIAGQSAAMEAAREVARRAAEETRDRHRDAVRNALESAFRSRDLKGPEEQWATRMADAWAEMKEATRRAEAALESVEQDVSDRTVAHFGAFREAVDAIDAYCRDHYDGNAAPWQLLHQIELPPSLSRATSNSGRVTLMADATDRHGRKIWESRCTVCNLVIQNGSQGQGTMRWRGMESDREERCIKCMADKRAALEVVSGAATFSGQETPSLAGKSSDISGREHDAESLRVLLAQDPHILDHFVEVSDHPVYMHVNGVSRGSVRDMLRSALHVYATQPLFSQPPAGLGVPQLKAYFGSPENWITYGEVAKRAEYVAAGLREELRLPRGVGAYVAKGSTSAKLDSGSPVVGILGAPSPAWYTADFAAAENVWTSVGLHLDWDVGSLKNALCVAGAAGTAGVQVADQGQNWASGGPRVIFCDEGEPLRSLASALRKLSRESTTTNGIHQIPVTSVQLVVVMASSLRVSLMENGDESVGLDGVKVITFDDLEALGKRSVTRAVEEPTAAASTAAEETVRPYHTQPEAARRIAAGSTTEQPPLYTLMFTSGSSGGMGPAFQPKAATVSDGLWVEEINGAQTSFYLFPLVGLSYTPASLAADRLGVWGTLANGGRMGFVASAAESGRVFEYATALGPTTLSAPPVVWTQLLDQFERRRAELEKLVPSEEAHQVALAEAREALGWRAKLIGTGGAVTPKKVLDFMRECFERDGESVISMVDTYGATEVGNIATDEKVDAGVHVRIVDVDTGKDAQVCVSESISGSDVVEVGEILVKTPRMTSGYFRNGEASCAAFNVEGWYRTGDLGEFRRSEGRLRVVGRVGERLRLSTEKWVSPAPLEAVFQDEIPEVEACFLCTVADGAALGAVVRVKDAVAPQLRDAKTREESRARILAYMRGFAGTSTSTSRIGLFKHLPKVLVLTDDVWSAESKLRTPSMKLKRSALAQKYADMLAMEWQRLQVEGSAEGVTIGEEIQLSVVIANLFAKYVGGDIIRKLSVEKLEESNFQELGGNSMQIVPLHQELCKRFGAGRLEVSDVLMKPIGTLVSLVEAAQQGGAAAAAHVKREKLVALMDYDRELPDLSLDQSLLASDSHDGFDRVDEAADSGLSQSDMVRSDGDASSDRVARAMHVVVTGATGFFGAHFVNALVVAWENAGVAGSIVCLVRGQDNAQAKQRFEEVLSRRKCTDALQALQVGIIAVYGISGLEHAKFGLCSEVYGKLVWELAGTAGVPSIVNAAAKVSVVDDYHVSRRENVTGTVEVLRFAASVRRLREERSMARALGVSGASTLSLLGFHHISTLSVFGMFADAGGRLGEASSIGDSAVESGVMGSHGYEQSKWVSEKLVSRAAADGGWLGPVPGTVAAAAVTIHRLGYVGPHAITGDFNKRGFVELLVQGSLHVQVAPPHAKMSMAPVDWVAQAEAALIIGDLNREAARGSVMVGEGSHKNDALTETQTSSLMVLPLLKPRILHVTQEPGFEADLHWIVNRVAKAQELAVRPAASWADFAKAVGVTGNQFSALAGQVRHGISASGSFSMVSTQALLRDVGFERHCPAVDDAMLVAFSKALPCHTVGGR